MAGFETSHAELSDQYRPYIRQLRSGSLADEAVFLSAVGIIAANYPAQIYIDADNETIEFVNCTEEVEHIVSLEIMELFDCMLTPQFYRGER